ncbi:16287_t:CDS:2, partial [Funneliformis mosseae]
MGRKFTRSYGRAGPPPTTRCPMGLAQVKHYMFRHAGSTKRFHDHAHAGATRQLTRRQNLLNTRKDENNEDEDEDMNEDMDEDENMDEDIDEDINENKDIWISF